MLRPTPGDPSGVKKHYWNTGVKENQELNHGGLSNRQKSSDPSQLKINSFMWGPLLSLTPTHRRAIKKGIKVFNRDWANH